MKSYFIAYPGGNTELSNVLLEFSDKMNEKSDVKTMPWEQLNVPGEFIRNKVLQEIDNSSYLIADISIDNFNVMFEIGYAIGSNKPIILTKNKLIESHSKEDMNRLGIYDTIGYIEYESSKDLLRDVLSGSSNPLLQPLKKKLNQNAPVYVIDTKFKTDFSSRILARVKKERLSFRTFDPNESSRMSAGETIEHVSQSLGVLVQFVSDHIPDFEIHNLRASFVAGLATGMNKTLCLIQYGESPIPIDFRDFTNSATDLYQVEKIIRNFARDVSENLQDMGSVEDDDENQIFLTDLDFGSSSAENEMKKLNEYYLKTDDFKKAERGEVQLVVGRKGAGKSAVFLQLRDRERTKGGNIVLDLKPEGYILLKFKNQVLDYLQSGTLQHTIMSFWEYLLLLEMAIKIISSDKHRHLADHDLYQPYRNLEEALENEKYDNGGDFSERMQALLGKIEKKYKAAHNYNERGSVKLSEPDITNLLHNNDIKILRGLIVDYLKFKKSIWILFDNIDKGWPTNGLTGDDLVIIRTLIDATSRLKRSFSKENIDLNPVVFLRNDVFELLVDSTADKGKESKVVLDWTDKDLLKELIKLRAFSISKNEKESVEKFTFDEIWGKICVKKYKKVDSIDFIIEQSLMRPRFLINLLNLCKSCAVNLNHKKIQEEDITKAMSSYSFDLLQDVAYEIRDVMPESADILYNFVGSLKTLTENELGNKISTENNEKVVDLLLWYGFLGIQINDNIKFIYNMNYNMHLIKGLAKSQGKEILYCINSAFWPSLHIE